MAKSVQPSTWERGFQEPSDIRQWEIENDDADFSLPPSKEVVTSPQHNELGINVLRTWPTLYDGTNTPHGIPPWWKPQKEVDVLICGGRMNVKWGRVPELTFPQLGPAAWKLPSALPDKACLFESLVC
jgi:hypothetical protein